MKHTDRCLLLGNVFNPKLTGGSFAGTLWHTNYVAPTLNTMGGVIGNLGF